MKKKVKCGDELEHFNVELYKTGFVAFFLGGSVCTESDFVQLERPCF